MCAVTICPLSSLTRNMAFGSVSTITPSISIWSSLAIEKAYLLLKKAQYCTKVINPTMDNVQNAGQQGRKSAHVPQKTRYNLTHKIDAVVLKRMDLINDDIPIDF